MKGLDLYIIGFWLCKAVMAQASICFSGPIKSGAGLIRGIQKDWP